MIMVICSYKKHDNMRIRKLTIVERNGVNRRESRDPGKWRGNYFPLFTDTG